MTTEQILRIKSAMIIYSLETSLGNFVLSSEFQDSISENNISGITNRLKEGQNFSDKDNITLLIESSYLDEVFNFAIDITKGTSYEVKMRSLKDFCSTLNIFDIRNAISHPNRPFPDTYWFRAATIASDPLILQLGLGEVRQALNAAQAEQLSPPPDDWINNVKWAIPNTLPESFDHEITGLLGRDSETKDLESTISKARNNLVAIVAPGGVGKTALILQFLKDISLNPKWSTKINAILFCTLKNERLTPDGIEKIEAINGIDQIKTSLLDDLNSIYLDKKFDSFEGATTQLESEKILICIDNLETLLVHSQEEFLNFNESLPLLWKVIVTSRISIDSATTVPIQPLGKRHAVNLCRNYFKRRGVSSFKQEDLENIAFRANNNPLAIRLTVDLYVKGIDIAESISKSQKDIAAFSYNNLIESLKEYSIWILEAIYVSGQVSKSQLLDLLELSNDEISESINELSKTSLVVRDTSETGNDQFKLSDSIKDLLLVNPINIEVRSKISNKVKERKNKIQEQLNRNQILGINEFDVEFISENISDTIRALVVDLNKALARPFAKRNHFDLVNLKNRFTELIAYNSSNHELLFHYSRILKGIRDEAGETQVIEEALKHDNSNPRYLFAKGLILFHQKDSEKANEIFEKLLNNGYGNPENSSKKYSSSLTKLNFLCLLNIGRYTEILERSIDWKNESDWKVMMGTYRATALKRTVEIKRHNYPEKEKAYSKILDIYEFIFQKESYPYLACNETLKFLKDLSSFNINASFSNDFVYKFIEFVANHFFNIVSAIKGQSIDNSDNRTFLEGLRNIKFESAENPLKNSKWFTPVKVEQYDKEHIEELLDEGYTIVRVNNIPENSFGMSSFIFAKDEEGNDFFLHVDNFEHGWTRWGYIKLHDKLGIKYERLSNDKATVPYEILEIDKFEI
ncbi:ATP-binding protein [Belliella sp. DSM 111904]|uniref:ATP-binding protein n=1 Tax=Belliella filtrata TaxID=2923435 RepID=A0ABS9V1A0_9BACT|nr:ATP-binding protein [Belliella filtrata]MCH7409989.1 ATP-binding protein [Belliella filtrata]